MPTTRSRPVRATREAEAASRDPRVDALLKLAAKAEAGYPDSEQAAYEAKATKARKDTRDEPGNVALRRAAGKLYRAVRARRTSPNKRKVPGDGARAVHAIAGRLETRDVDTLTPGDTFARNPDGTRCGRLVSVAFGWAEVEYYSHGRIGDTDVARVKQVTIARRSPVHVPVGTPVCTTNLAGPTRPDWVREAAAADKAATRGRPRA